MGMGEYSPRVASPRVYSPGKGGHGASGPTPKGSMVYPCRCWNRRGWCLTRGEEGGKPTSVPWAQGAPAPPYLGSFLVGFASEFTGICIFTSKFTSTFTNIASKFANILGLDCM